MSYKIEKDIINGLNQRELQSKSLIIAHDSGNPNNTGKNSLENEIKYMKNNWNKPPSYAYTSHWVGSGGKIVQLAEAGKRQNGAGGKANPHSVAHVELARTNNKETFKKDYEAYVWLLRKLADDWNIPKTLDAGSGVSDKGIKGHAWVSKNLGGTDHVDPYPYLESWGIKKSQFKKDIEKGSSNDSPNKESNTTYKGSSIVDYLKSIGEDSSVSNRKKLAKEYGVKKYKTTAEKNSELLNVMRDGKKPSKEKAPTSSNGSPVKLKVGNKVKIKSESKNYATGETIPSHVKERKHTIQQVKSDKVLLKEIYSWVNKKDIEGTSKNSTIVSFKVGNKVKIKSSASKYSTGETIPAQYKRKNYTIQQVKSSKVLLKELVSWVDKKDLE